ncbi:MAG: D-sedoheptulose 7-phosphate isomerase [Bacteroidota bacterium]
MSFQKRTKSIIQANIDLKQSILTDQILLEKLETAVNWSIKTFSTDGKLLFCGNGGSAADAQHLAAEFSGRFYKDRPPLFAEALHVNTSFFTAVCNDYSFEDVYARNVQAMGREGDLLFCISTSGNSQNVLNALLQAKEQGMKTIALTGSTGGKLAEHCDLLLNVPSEDTPRIQEAHILLGHIICELVEEDLF